MAPAQTPGRAGDRSREVNLSLNRTVALFMPIFLFALSAYASWVVVSEVSLKWFFNPPAIAQLFGILPRHGAGIAIIVIYFILLLLWYMPYLRVLYTLTTNPGVLPIGQPGAEKNTNTRGLEEFLDKEMYICEHGGAINPRWCEKCRIWKPDRAHHCSEINRCVRRMDHFCPWVGGIVSETNYKFFVQFCFYAALYTGFCMIVLAIVMAERIRQTPLPVDINWAICLGISSLFTLFTFGMFLSSSQMTLNNMTTIESLNRHTAIFYLAVRIMSPQPGQGVYGMGPNRYIISNTEPGDNPWDLGYYRNWCSIMGDHWFDWLLPIRLSPHTKHESSEGEFEWGPAARKLMVQYRTGYNMDIREGPQMT